LTLFVYAQNQTTCEQKFSLQNESCTPCQQVLFKYKEATDNIKFLEKPTDKCLVSNFLAYYVTVSSLISDKTVDDITKVKGGIELACADTAKNPCNESTAKSIYTEIDKACDVELNQYYSVKETGKVLSPSENVGLLAEKAITIYYMAIPSRENMCVEVEGGKLLSSTIVISFTCIYKLFLTKYYFLF
jgi:hypothetical protein